MKASDEKPEEQPRIRLIEPDSLREFLLVKSITEIRCKGSTYVGKSGCIIYCISTFGSDSTTLCRLCM